MPTKLLEQAIDAVSRIGMVTRSNAAEFSVTARREATISLGIYSNRYSLTLFMPLACFLLVFGRQLILKWLGRRWRKTAARCYRSLSFPTGSCWRRSSIRVRYCSASIAMAATPAAWSSRRYSISPRWPGPYRASASGALPGFPRFPCSPCAASILHGSCLRALDYSFFSYMSGIYVRPLLVGVPAWSLADAAQADRPPRTEHSGIDPGRRDLRPSLFADRGLRLHRAKSSRAVLLPHSCYRSALRGRPCVVPPKSNSACARNSATWRCSWRPPALRPGSAPEPPPLLPDPAKVAAALRGTALCSRGDRASPTRSSRTASRSSDSTIETGPAIDWRRDYLHGVSTGTPYFRRSPYLDFSRAGDHKVVWELNRHQHLPLLAQAFLLTGEREYLDEAFAQLAGLARGQPVPARHQLGQRPRSRVPRALLGVVLADGGRRDARTAARALPDRTLPARPLPGTQSLGLLLAQHASAGRGRRAARARRPLPRRSRTPRAGREPAAASSSSRCGGRSAKMAATSSSPPTITSTRWIFSCSTACWRSRPRHTRNVSCGWRNISTR